MKKNMVIDELHQEEGIIQYCPVKVYNKDLAYNQANVLGPIAILNGVIDQKMLELYKQAIEGIITEEQFRNKLETRIALLLDTENFDALLEGIYSPYYNMDQYGNPQRLFHTPKHPDEITTLIASNEESVIDHPELNKMQLVRAAVRLETNGREDQPVKNIASYICNMLKYYGNNFAELKYMAMIDLSSAGHDSIYHSDGRIRGETLINLKTILEEVPGSNGNQLQWTAEAKRDPKFRFLYKMLEHKNWATIYDNPPAGPGPNEALSAINLAIYMAQFNIPEREQVKIITVILNTKPFDDHISQYRYETCVRQEYKLLQAIDQRAILRSIASEKAIVQMVTAQFAIVYRKNIDKQLEINNLERKIEMLLSLDRELGADLNKLDESAERIINETNELLFNNIRAGNMLKAKKLQEKLVELKQLSVKIQNKNLKGNLVITLNESMKQVYQLQEGINMQKKEVLKLVINSDLYSMSVRNAMLNLIENFDTPTKAVQAGLDFTNLGDIGAFLSEHFLIKEKAFLAENNINLRKDDLAGYDFVQILQNANDWFYSEYLITGLKSGSVAIFHAGPPHYNLEEAHQKNQKAAENLEAALLLNKARYAAGFLATALADQDEEQEILLSDFANIGKDETLFTKCEQGFKVDQLDLYHHRQYNQVLTELLNCDQVIGDGYPSTRGFHSDFIAARLLEKIGPDKIVQFADKIREVLTKANDKAQRPANISTTEYNLTIKGPVRTEALREKRQELLSHATNILSLPIVVTLASAVSLRINLHLMDHAKKEVIDRDAAAELLTRKLSKEKAHKKWGQVAATLIPKKASPIGASILELHKLAIDPELPGDGDFPSPPPTKSPLRKIFSHKRSISEAHDLTLLLGKQEQEHSNLAPLLNLVSKVLENEINILEEHEPSTIYPLTEFIRRVLKNHPLSANEQNNQVLIPVIDIAKKIAAGIPLSQEYQTPVFLPLVCFTRRLSNPSHRRSSSQTTMHVQVVDSLAKLNLANISEEKEEHTAPQSPTTRSPREAALLSINITPAESVLASPTSIAISLNTTPVRAGLLSPIQHSTQVQKQLNSPPPLSSRSSATQRHAISPNNLSFQPTPPSERVKHVRNIKLSKQLTAAEEKTAQFPLPKHQAKVLNLQLQLPNPNAHHPALATYAIKPRGNLNPYRVLTPAHPSATVPTTRARPPATAFPELNLNKKTEVTKSKWVERVKDSQEHIRSKFTAYVEKQRRDSRASDLAMTSDLSQFVHARTILTR